MWILSALGAITGLLGPISNIIGKLYDLNIAKIKATEDITVTGIQAEIDATHDKAMVLTAEMGSRLAAIITSFIQTLLALPVAIFLWKVIIWDKVIGSWPDYSTELANSSMLWWVIISVVGFYFVTIFRK